MDLIKELTNAVALDVFESFEDFEKACLKADKSNTVAAAILLGLRSQNIGQAFAGGYRCALQALVPSLNSDEWAAMCVTESKGNHPKQIETKLSDQNTLNGVKSFVTMAEKASQLIVLAKSGAIDGRPLLKAVLVNGNSSGVTINSMPSLGMIPDIPHGQLVLDNVEGQLLNGDGYSDYSKRFRTLEDLHVLAAFTSLLLSICVRYELPEEMISKGLFILDFCLNSEKADTSLLHLNLNHAFAMFGEMSDDLLSFETLPEPLVQEWKRDSRLFKIASKARQSRKDKALAVIREKITALV